MSKAWLSVKDAAEYLGLGVSAIYQMAASGELNHYRIGPRGGKIRFKASDLEEYLAKARRGPKAKAPRSWWIALHRGRSIEPLRGPRSPRQARIP